MENRNIRSYSNYIDGSAVRKIQRKPEIRPEKREYEEERRNSRQRAAARNRQKELRMSPMYVLFLTAITIVTAVVCVRYLKLQTSIMSRNESIINMEKNLDTLVSQNDAIEYAISSYIDTDYVVKVATGELGMVKASESQISFYESSESEYMKQLEDIPNN